MNTPPDPCPIPPGPAWGKRRADGREQALVLHCRDVAAVFVALLRLPGVRWRLARLAGVADLTEPWIERLGWFAYLHDLGKVNAGFQARRDPRARMIGHVKPIAGAFAPIIKGLEIEKHCAGWGDEAGLLDWFHAVLSHHGQPWIAPEDIDSPENRARFALCWKGQRWKGQPGYTPAAALRELGQAGRALFPAAFIEGASLPLPPRLIHALAGLTMLADWIASADWENSLPADQGTSASLAAWARTRLAEIGLDPAGYRSRLTARALDFTAAFGFAPTPAQAAFAQAAGQLAILESETGSGKTEAALWRFVERFRAGAVDGLYFALPTRTAAVQLHRRVATLVATLWPEDPPPVVLAVPGYLDDEAAGEGGGGALPPAGDPVDAAESDPRTAPIWAAEHPKRYFSAMIGVGTIDQALLAGLRTKHAHLRGAALMRLMLVVDEVHASDLYGQELIEALLADHLAAGGEAILLSATLGARAHGRYAGGARLPTQSEAAARPYPAMTIDGTLHAIPAAGRTRRVAMSLAADLADPAAIAGHAIDAAQAGAKVLVVRNTVSAAIAVQQALEAALPAESPLLFRVGGVATLHHGRFAREDRRRLDAAVEVALGKTRPAGGLILVGTQTLEQSLDIDADYLLSDLCPVDVLLQRLGRLHRHAGRVRPEGFATPRARVLTPGDDLTALLAGQGLGFGLGPRPAEARGVYPDVIAVEAALHPEARAQIVAEQPEAVRDRWQQHAQRLDGTGFADSATARRVRLRRDLPFMHAENAVCSDEMISTRLGEGGLLVDLPPGLIGPFGTPIRRLVIPGWWPGWSGGRTLDVPVVDGESLVFGELSCTYNRFGLIRCG